ncbi:MAG TPA: hypothetical protein VGR15_08235, partial [Bacteroidota bacterium]|nr:hypothetical protein [Bacteroidota bacterium]
GSGVAPHFSLTPSFVSFGNVHPDSMKYDSVLVRNGGSSSLLIDSVISTDGELIVVPASAAVAPADSQRFYLTFHPVSQYESRVDTILFLHNAAGSPGLVVCTARNELTLVSPVQADWNLISVPLTVTDSSKTVLFPTAISNAFAWEDSYAVKPKLSNGLGYWLKFAGAETISVSGLARNIDTFAVVAGWNLIGSISTPVQVGTIISDPGGMVTSKFFGYGDGYHSDSTIDPGNGHWVKVSQSGRLFLSSTATGSPLNRIRILPTGELPPAPPEGGGILSSNITPDAFTLAQNFPNPFNPRTDFGFSVPHPAYRDLVVKEGEIVDAGFVTLKVFDVLGREVATIVNENLPPGSYRRTWDATGFSSGMYFYELKAGRFRDVKKLIFLR